MKTVEDIQDFLGAFVAWASRQSDIQGVALVGSYARAAAKDDSDIDLVILTERPRKYLDEIQWPKRFGVVERHQTEEHGKLISSRIWYQNGQEVDYGITTPDWAAIPLEPGAREVIEGGMVVLFERETLLSRHVNG